MTKVRSDACHQCYFTTRRGVSTYQRLISKAVTHQTVLPCRSNPELVCHNYFEEKAHLIEELKVAKELKQYEYVLPGPDLPDID